jgi:hypothetical protein
MGSTAKLVGFRERGYGCSDGRGRQGNEFTEFAVPMLCNVNVGRSFAQDHVIIYILKYLRVSFSLSFDLCMYQYTRQSTSFRPNATRTHTWQQYTGSFVSYWTRCSSRATGQMHFASQHPADSAARPWRFWIFPAPDRLEDRNKLWVIVHIK